MPPRPPGAGLAPLFKSGAKPEDVLTAQERQCVTEPMRRYQETLQRRGNEPGRRACDECVRLAAAGLLQLEQLRQAADGEVDINVAAGPPEFSVTTFKEGL